MPDDLDSSDAPARPILQRVVASGQAVATELGLDHRSIDVKLLSFLRDRSRFGIFTLGPLTIRLAHVQEVIERTTSREGDGLTDDEEAAFDEFFPLLAKEQAKHDGTPVTELDLLLTFMRMRHGVAARVFGELGVSPERIEQFVRSGSDGPADLEALYSPEDAAEYLGVHVETVRSWIRSGRLRAHRLAGQRALRIRASDLTRVLEPLDPEGD